MYDELVRRLRAQADAERYFVGEDMLYDKAADVIEELTRENKELSFRSAQLEAMNDALIGETGAADALMVVSQPRWIPVAERLPDEDVEVLVVAVNDFNHDDRWVSIDWLYSSMWQQHEIVTHWMPLPSTEGLNET